MTTKILFSGEGIGEIPNELLQKILTNLNLGTLIEAKNTDQGAMKQTMFIISTQGEYVLKGNPVYAGQLEEEQFFVNEIAMRTNVPVPIPYEVDHTKSILQFPYAMMPLLDGHHISSFKGYLANEKQEIVKCLANTLQKMHNWKVSICGEYNPTANKLEQFEKPFHQWLTDRITYWLKDAEKYSVITKEDWEWTSKLLDENILSLQDFKHPRFVMGDFKPGNCLLKKQGDQWHVLGVFDFTNSYFGDPLADLIKYLIILINENDLKTAQYFVQTYLGDESKITNYYQRIKLHLLHQLILDWGCAKAINMVTWDDSKSFKNWAKEYMNSIDNLFAL